MMMAPIEKLKFFIMANLIRQKFYLIYKAREEDFLINNKSGEFRNNKENAKEDHNFCQKILNKICKI